MNYKAMLAAAIVLGGAATAAAQPAVAGYDPEFFEQVAGPDGITTIVPRQQQVAPKAGTIPLRLTLDLTGPDGEKAGGIQAVQVIKDNVDYISLNKVFTDTTFMVEPGTYDAYCIFYTTPTIRMKKRVGHYAFDMKEGYKVDSATTIAFSFKDCTHRIGLSPTLPSGEKYKGGKYDWANKKYFDDDSTNCVELTIQMIFRDNLLKMHNRTYPRSYVYIADVIDHPFYWNGQMIDYAGAAMLTSDASDAFSLSWSLGLTPVGKLNEPVALGFAKAGFSADVTLENKVSDFVKVPVSVKRNKLSKGYQKWATGVDSRFGVSGMRYALPLANDLDAQGVTSRTMWGACVYDGYDRWNDTLPYVFRSDELDYWGKYYAASSQTTNFYHYGPFFQFEDGKAVAYDVHPAMKFSSDQIDGTLGNNVPVTVVKWMNYVRNGVKKSYTDATFRGRFNEQCETPQSFTTSTVYDAAGNAVYTGEPNTLYSNLPKLTGSTLTGVTKVVITNDIFTVDSIEGKNVSTFDYDISRTDFTPPTLRLLQLRNKATGHLTDRFAENSADDVIAIEAIDENYNYSTATYDKGVLSAKLSWAPNGSTEWTSLPVAAVGDTTSTYCFQGNLAEVKQQSPNKWYDVRVEVTDAAGNKVTQVISPAFRLEKINTSGVAQVETAKVVQSVRYYNLQGQQSATPFQGVNIQLTRYTDGSTRTTKLLK